MGMGTKTIMGPKRGAIPTQTLSPWKIYIRGDPCPRGLHLIKWEDAKSSPLG